MSRDRIKKYEPLWGSWYVEEFIGKGSFGSVYKVSKEELGYKYTSAVKLISVPTEEQYQEAETSIGIDQKALYSYFSDIVKTIVNEVNVMYQLRGNTNIVNYEDHMVVKKENEFGWDILVRMEIVDSLPLYMKSCRLSREQVVRLGIDICSSLETCLKEGIIHRDIKEENVFVTNKGIFKLGDFGIARELSKTGRAASSKGTPIYMAPEVYKGEKYDNTVDIYSLGIVMYKLLNYNRTPFMPAYPQEIKFKDNEEAFEKRLSGVDIPIPQNAGGKLQDIILKACAYKSSIRYQNPIEMRSELKIALKEMSLKDKEENVTLIRTKNIVLETEIIVPSLCESKIEDTVLLDKSTETEQIKQIREELRNLIKDTGKAEEKNIVENRDSDKLVEVERIKGTQIIAVAGTMARVGATHTTINLAQYLKNKYFKVAIFEKHNSTTFESIKSAYSETENKETSFTIAGIDYYPYNQYTKMSDLLNKGYNYIVLDMGIYKDCDQEEFERANERVIVSGTKDWEMDALEKFLKMKDRTGKTTYYFTFAAKDTFQIIIGSMKKGDCYKAPYNPQIFEVNEESAATFEKMLDGILPRDQKKRGRWEKSSVIHRNPMLMEKQENGNKKPEIYQVDDRFDGLIYSNKTRGKLIIIKYMFILLLIAGAATLVIYLIMLALKGKPSFNFNIF